MLDAKASTVFHRSTAKLGAALKQQRRSGGLNHHRSQLHERHHCGSADQIHHWMFQIRHGSILLADPCAKFTRRGLDWTGRYPSIATAVAALSCRV
jgi:hypothetical protein